MRKLLISWCRGPLNVRLFSRDIDILSNRFIDEGTIEIVPNNWMNGSKCFWPPLARPSQIKKLVLLFAEPAGNWRKYDAVIMKTTTFQKTEFHFLEEIKEEQKKLRAMFSSNFCKGKHYTELPPDCPRLPYTSPEELVSLNSYLEDTKDFSLMCKHFGPVGGSTINNVVRRILQNILSNPLTSVREHSMFEKTTDNEVEISVKTWLVYAKDREGADRIE
ncbi:hypothetical protein AVEN_15017-1 [Araneus ventricosus]|uniref:DUF4806 domain-containing protein n=1 Tax=Araneus ventricosus TaxID=182803 RepID=A0A4Y2FTL0_ARAVE|nr:hypothetical protein AVEN_15017-1 [Araneus ventricosus]